MAEQYLTYQTRLKSLSDMQECFLMDYARLFCQSKHKYYALKKSGACQTRKDYFKAIGSPFPYRVMQGIQRSVAGLIESQLSNRKNYIAQYESKLDNLQSRICKKQNRIDNQLIDSGVRKKESYHLLKMKEKSARLRSKIKRLKADKESHICFGGKQHLKKRHEVQNLKELKAWKTEWRNKRYHEIFLIGSHDEAFGNSQCQMTEVEEDVYQISINTPEQFVQDYGKRVIIGHIDLKSDKHNYVKNAVLLNQYVHKNRKDKSVKGVPLTFKFNLKNGKWYLNITVRLPEQDIVSDSRLGSLGVDINENHLAVAEVDHHGNYINNWTIPLALRNKTTEQRSAIIGDAVKRLISLAKKKRKPVIYEDLDFIKKKAVLKKENREYSRMLSSFAYKKIKDTIMIQCLKSGIEYKVENPAYSSIIGKLKYANRFGLSVHHSAALVIARRGMGIWDKAPRRIYQVTKNNQLLSHEKRNKIKPSKTPVRKGSLAISSYADFLKWKKGLLREIKVGMRLSEAKALLKARLTPPALMS